MNYRADPERNLIKQAKQNRSLIDFAALTVPDHN